MQRAIHTITDNFDGVKLPNQASADLTDNIRKYGLIYPVVINESN